MSLYYSYMTAPFALPFSSVYFVVEGYSSESLAAAMCCRFSVFQSEAILALSSAHGGHTLEDYWPTEREMSFNLSLMSPGELIQVSIFVKNQDHRSWSSRRGAVVFLV